VTHLVILLMLSLASLSGGCASLINSSTVDVTVTTTPSDALATFNGQAFRTTMPVTIPVPRGKDGLVIHIEKEGYESQEVRLERRFVGWVWGNVVLGLVGGPIGMGIDLISQRAWSVDPREFQVSLKPAMGVAKLPSRGGGSLTPRVAPSAVASDVDQPRRLHDGRKQNAHAVVVGLDSYRNRLPRADFAGDDARVVAAYVAQTMGYEPDNVALLLNEHATKGDFEKYMESWLPNRVEDGDSVFIYYSGHGAPHPKTGEAYLVPYDGDPTFIEKTGYPLARLYDHLATLPAKEIVVVLDSCFSGAGGRSVIAPGIRPIVTELKSPLLAKGKTVVLAASTGQQVSSTYEQKGHGLLTYFFLKGLQGEADTNKDGAIDLVELFDYLKPQVERIARREFNNEQTPQLLGGPELLTRDVRLLE
jgi:hypothetical protein